MTVEETINTYPFLKYINEDKSHYVHAKDKGFNDPDDLFLIGDSGGFLMNINPGDRFVNTYLFTEMADFYRKNGCYTFLKVDSIPHRQLRKREEYRRRFGYSAPCLQKADGSIVDVRITGAHYNFLNYTLMEKLNYKSISKSNNLKAEKIYDFSDFIDAQFWTWHCMEFAERNGFHFIIDKTRRGGFSYMMASDTANLINLNKRKVIIHVAADKKYLIDTGGLTDFTINNLRFYEAKTPFVRGIFSTDKEKYKLGFKEPNGVESSKSWGSTVLSVSAMNNPNCAIGKDAVKVKVEELSTMENFDDFMDVTEPAMRTGSYTTGMLLAWGTATKGNMQTFEQNFYSPEAYKFMPFENVWDKDMRSETCGYFKPYCWGLQGEIQGMKAMDKDGNSDLAVGIRIAEHEREVKKTTSKTFSEYINYLGQYANYPAESFSSTTENLFNSEELLTWAERLRTDNSFRFYVDGKIIEDEEGNVRFKTNERCLAEGGKFNETVFAYIENVPRKSHEHPHGCIRQWFAPQTLEYVDKDGKRKRGVPEGLYSICYDPVGINKENRELTNRHSHNSIYVFMNPHAINNFRGKLVATYYGRPEKLEEADRICLNLARLYNCIGTTCVETNRGETVSNFTKWKALKYLAKDPVFVFDTSVKGAVSNNYGISMGDGTRKLEGLRLLKEMLYTEVGKDEFGNPLRMFQTIYDYQTILEIIKWNNIGNFDRVSSLIIRAVEVRAMDIIAEQQIQRRKRVDTYDEYSTNIMRRDWF